jgi:hypothetical protein
MPATLGLATDKQLQVRPHMSHTLYRYAIEALGSRSKKNIVVNMFNRVAAKSKDPKLRALCELVIYELGKTSSLPEATPVKDMRSVKTAPVLLAYCLERAYL